MSGILDLGMACCSTWLVLFLIGLHQGHIAKDHEFCVLMNVDGVLLVASELMLQLRESLSGPQEDQPFPRSAIF
jgi:hypothetical protein